MARQMTHTRELLSGHPIVPVIVIDDAAAAEDLAAALAAGGVHCAEITLRTAEGVAALSAIADLPGFTAGAGTVLTLDHLRRCLDSGARFIVSPGLDEELVSAALEAGVAVLPGVATATEVQRAARLGLDVVKFFPADRLGGLGTIAALAAPFVGMGFVPSGGVGNLNSAEYLAHPAVPAVSGSWLAPRDLIAARNWGAIERLTREAVTAVETP